MEKFKNKIICGDALKVLKEIPDESIDCVITSPPYWCLRDYKIEGQIGLEENFDKYLNKLLEIFAEIKRVLKKSGSFWLNIGDAYGAHPAGNKFISEANIGQDGVFVRKMIQNVGAKSFTLSADRLSPHLKPKYIKEKCILMMPERIALKMVDEQGWILRQKIIWAKQILINKENRTIGSVMPMSVKDRFNMSWEYLYHFVKNKKYYFNLDAVRIPAQVVGVIDLRPAGILRQRRNERKRNKTLIDPNAKGLRQAPEPGEPNAFHPLGKNIPTVWQINPEPHNFQKEVGADTDHFATYPQELCRIPILSSCPPDGIVLDPFAGSGTTLLVAKKLGRNYLGIELNPDYVKISQARLNLIQSKLL